MEVINDGSCRPKTKTNIGEVKEGSCSKVNTGSSTSHNDGYFASYEDPEIHRLMVSDKPRTDAYRDAILKNSHLFHDKVVMDVGAGTGILSLFMAAAGARKVYSVEASRMSSLISQVAHDNGFQDIIKVLPCPVEEVVLEDNEKVDVIVSEWMGFYLLHESMLNSVIIARDKFLADDGKMFPSEAKIYACPCSLVNLYEEQIDFWDNVYGFNMSAIKNMVTKAKMIKPEVHVVPPSDLLAEPVCIKSLILDAITENDLKEITETSFVGTTRAGLYQGLCLWFECDFDGREYDEDGEETGTIVTLSTSPFSPPTHWKQTVIVFGNQNGNQKDEGHEEDSKDFKKHKVEDPRRKESGVSMQSECDMDFENDADDASNNIPKSLHYEVEEDNVVGWKLNLTHSLENKRHYNVTFEMLDPEVDEHPIPCNCPMSRCLIIAKMIEKEEEGI